MELDDFRLSWQRVQPSVVNLDGAQLQNLLKARPGLVEKMRRNARVEMGITALLMILVALVLLPSQRLLTVLQLAFIEFIGLGQLYYYYYKLGVLRRMATVEGNVRHHLQKLCSELRRLLRFFYRATLVVGPFSLFLGFCYMLGQEVARPNGLRIKFLLIMGLVLLVLGAMIQLVAVYGTRWYVQRLYGQHLDRLEAALQELED